MKRLIDGQLLADVILGEIYKHGQESGNYDDYLEIGALTHNDIAFLDGYDKALDDVYRQIGEMKTVRAIPVDWITNYLHELNKQAEEEMDFIINELGGYETCHMMGYVIGIEKMLEKWEKENEH